MPQSQLFKSAYPLETFKEHVRLFCERGEKEDIYVYTKVCYKRAVLVGTMTKFIKDVAPYYHISKQKYADVSLLTYKSSANVIRQLCKYHNIPIETKIKYINSTYETEYIITELEQNNVIMLDHPQELASLIDEQTKHICDA